MQVDRLIRDKYTVVIGLEVHAQLLTASKIYAPDSNQFGCDPNTNISVITLGHPGVMPKLNKKVVEYAIKMGLACHSEISPVNIFDRKNYFYPDLPKGYQLTQDTTPICQGGYIPIRLKNGETKEIGLFKIHIEEDAGKSIHAEGESDTLVDFNRAGVPLIEIVTKPEIRSSVEATVLLSEIRRLVRYLDICDGDMEKGSMRCDANVSVMLNGADQLGNKVEVKNMNSIRNVQRAIDHEIKRQILELEKGNQIPSETRTFHDNSGTTSGMREKEQLNDYRYFPEPDLSPLIISKEWLADIKQSMPELPRQLLDKFISEYQLPEYDAQFLTDSKTMAHYFMELCELTHNYKAASNWIMGPVKSYLNDNGMGMSDFPIEPKRLSDLIKMADEGKISFTVASQKVFPQLLSNSNITADAVVKDLNLVQDSDTGNIQPLIDEVLASLPDKVEAYKKGKKGLLGLFMGEVMKKSEGKANPRLTNELLKKCLDQSFEQPLKGYRKRN
ncbi:MAG: Asp-tRNA(Asn)/Glu-tRNA(Gln) amidotransferase subunit GatB [Bacteroidetes bacterium]|nr:Asp-tRNA(Asn)/Glu-tRNA(Gln) amidotransferase subunit GatB [Bacteroidota bacterium]